MPFSKAVALAAAFLVSPVVPEKGDVFSERYQSELRDRLRREKASLNLDSVSRDWVDHIRALPAESDSRQAYVQFLKERYDYVVARLNEAYGLDAQSFTELTSLDFRRLDRSRKAVVEDDAEFVKSIRDVLLRVAREAGLVAGYPKVHQVPISPFLRDAPEEDGRLDRNCHQGNVPGHPSTARNAERLFDSGRQAATVPHPSSVRNEN